MDQPPIGDVFGEMIRDAYAVRTGIGPRPLAGGRLPRPVIEIIERDDGLINGAPADHYLDEPAELAAVRPPGRATGAAGACSTSASAPAGPRSSCSAAACAVTGLDISPGAIEVARGAGVRDTGARHRRRVRPRRAAATTRSCCSATTSA